MAWAERVCVKNIKQHGTLQWEQASAESVGPPEEEGNRLAFNCCSLSKQWRESPGNHCASGVRWVLGWGGAVVAKRWQLTAHFSRSEFSMVHGEVPRLRTSSLLGKQHENFTKTSGDCERLAMMLLEEMLRRSLFCPYIAIAFSNARTCACTDLRATRTSAACSAG